MQPRTMTGRRYALLATVALVAALPCCEVPATHPLSTTATARAHDDLELAEVLESNEQTGPAGVQGVALEQVLALRPRLDSYDRGLADRWIADHVHLFRDVYRVPDVAAKLPRESPFHRAERAFASWIAETRYDRRDRDFAREVFSLPAEAMPNLDRFALGIEQLRGDDPALQAFVLYCGRSRETADQLVQWLATSLAATKDTALVDHVLGQALLVDTVTPDANGFDTCPLPPWTRCRALHEFVRLWSASAAYPEVWTRGALALAAASPSLDDPLVLTTLRQAWGLWPLDRGTLLYVIARAAARDDHFRRCHSAANHFEAEIGSRPLPADVTAMISLGPAAVEDVLQIWDTVLLVDDSPAGHLSNVVTAAVAALPQAAKGAAPDAQIEHGLRSVAVSLCREGKHVELQQMRDRLKGRAVARAVAAREVSEDCNVPSSPLVSAADGQGC